VSSENREIGARAELEELIRLSWPIVWAQMALVAMGLVDTAVLGRVSVNDLAGASIGRSIGFGAASLTMGVAMGLEPLATQALGAGEPARARGSLVATLKAGALTWAPMALFAFGVTLVLEPMGVEHAVVTRARWYLLGQLPGLGLYGVFIAAKTFLQAHGKTRPALVAAIVANFTNFVICSLLVRGDDALRAIGLPGVGLPRLGAFGAGLATTLAEILLVTIVLRAARAVHDGRTEHVPVALALKVGVPVGLQLFAEIGIFALVALFSGKLGAVVASAHQIAIGLASFTYMAALGVSGATAVRVGRAVGEGRSARRAGVLGIALGAFAQGLGAIVFAIAPRALVGVFTDDAAVLATGADLVVIAAVFQLFDGVQGVAGGALRGAGDVRFAFAANVVAYWALGLPVALWLGFATGWGARGLWWGMTLGLMAAALVLGARFVLLSGRVIARVDQRA
jgi:MATE family multidrug resistance protein